ncbi:tyrosine-protein phosphatase [Paenibacillus marinisediminis]
MIDLHCHILPGLDDGASDMGETLRMAAYAVKQGIHTIVATPHHRTRHHDNPSDKIREALQQVQNQLAQARLPIRLLTGQEYRLNAAYMQDLAAGHMQTLADSCYLLVELPQSSIPVYFHRFIADMTAAGVNIVIAHPERHLSIVSQPSILESWIAKGILLQVTAPSLIGEYGRKIQKTAMWICKQRWAHLLGSDAHHIHTRQFHLKEAYAAIAKHVSVEYMEEVKRNAELVIAGKQIEAGNYALLPRGKFLQ